MNSDIKILYLIDKKEYIQKMSRVRFSAMKKLGEFTNLIFWGPNWNNYDNNKNIQDNISKMNYKIDLIICYKPELIKGCDKIKITRTICYNEMWDEKYTLNQINNYSPDFVVCHHENDMKKYQEKYLKDIFSYFKFVHIPHCAENTIFYDKKQCDKNIDILLCGTVGKHYPIRQRLVEIIKIMPKEFKCAEYKHPGYIHTDAFTNIYLQDFASAINNAKICITCTSKYKYRLGKLVEIPMCNSVLCSDIPEQDQETFGDIMITINENMSNEEIVEKLTFYLKNPIELEKIRKKGYEWSQKYIQDFYAKSIIENYKLINDNKKSTKIYVLADELKNMKEKWICDIFKEEFTLYSKLNVVDNPKDADIIWLLAPWSIRKINKEYLQKKFVITTIHHIDDDKYNDNIEYYKNVDNITNRYHSICEKSTEAIKKITNKKIITANFWINENNYYKIYNKNELRKKNGIPENAYVIGSFQKDTEGKDDNLPKLSKGPDIFVKIIEEMKKTNKNIFIILTGWRRTYVMRELDKINIKYAFFELVDLVKLNELYNCLDLYIVSSRVEGGPRSILECGLARIPIISTDVGIARLILADENIYDMNNILTYKNAKINIEHAFEKSKYYTIENYMHKFVNEVFYEI
jgi:hypothetical protein